MYSWSRTRRLIVAASVPGIVAATATAQLPQIESAHLAVPGLEHQDLYGFSVAVWRDWAIVGGQRVGPSAPGAAYLFRRGPTGWVLKQELVASDAEPIDFFGSTVAIEGDTVMVGSYFGGPLDTGQVYVFERQGPTWVEVQKLVGSDVQPYVRFSHSISISGNTAVIGAPFSDEFFDGSGSAYIFRRTMTGWEETTKLLPPPLQFPHSCARWFGWSAAVFGDEIVVGAPGGEGAVHVFKETTNGWTRKTSLFDPGPTNGDESFGRSVDIDGKTIIVGEPILDGVFSPQKGSAFIFEKGVAAPGKWTLTAEIKASDGFADDKFGGSVDVEGDRVVVGARKGDYNGPNSGTAYLFERGPNGWTESTRLVAGDTASPSAKFGHAVAINGPYILVGAPEAEIQNMRPGTAYVFEIELGTSYCAATPNSTGTAASLAVVGSETVGDENLTLSVKDCPTATFGLFFFGSSQTQKAFGEGVLCVGGTIARLLPAARSGPSGAAMHDVDFANTTISSSLVAGTTWNFQFWYRDPTGGPSGFNLSNAVEVGFE